jgi:hypothetical protein
MMYTTRTRRHSYKYSLHIGYMMIHLYLYNQGYRYMHSLHYYPSHYWLLIQLDMLYMMLSQSLIYMYLQHMLYMYHHRYQWYQHYIYML